MKAGDRAIYGIELGSFINRLNDNDPIKNSASHLHNCLKFTDKLNHYV